MDTIIGTILLIFILTILYKVGKCAIHEFCTDKPKVITARDIIAMKEIENKFKK